MTFWFGIAFMSSESLHISLVHFMLINYTYDSKSQTFRMRCPFQSTGRPISHRNGWSFRVYIIPLRDFVPEWNSHPGTRRGELTPGWLTLAWHFVVEHEREPEWTCSGAKVAPVSCTHPLRSERRYKNSSKPFPIHSRSSLKNHTQFQTKMGKVYTRFQTKTAQKPHSKEGHIPI